MSEVRSVLQFDGDDSVEIQDPFGDGGDFTMSLWVKPSVVDTGDYVGLLGKEGDWRRKPSLWMAPDREGLTYDLYTAHPWGDRWWGTVNGVFTKDQWVHLVWIKDGRTFRFYRNAELIAVRTAPRTFFTKASSYFIGRVDNFWQGQIADVGFWSTVRTREQIHAGMHARPAADEPGLKGFWPLDDGEDGVAHDLSSSANHGTIQGATQVQSELPPPAELPAAPEVGPAPVLVFDGQGDPVELGDRPAFKVAKTLTLEAWVKVAAQEKWAGILSNVFDSGSQESGYGILLDGESGVTFGLKPEGAGLQYLSSGAGSVELDRWHHVATTYDGARMTIYVDGVERAYKDVSASAIDYDPDNPLYLGAYKDDNETYAFQGQVAEVRIWDVARTRAEIRSTKDQRLAGDEAGLVAYWQLSEGAGDTASDAVSEGEATGVAGATWQLGELPFGITDETGELEPVVELGEGQYLEIEDPFDTDTDFTLSLWVRAFDVDEVSWRGLIGKRGDTHPKPSLALAPGGGRLYYECRGRTGRDYSATLNGFFEEDRWVHLAWVKDGAKFEIYRDGTRIFETRNAPPRFYKKKSSYWIGKGEHSWQGQIAEVRIWKTARTPDQISADVNRRLSGEEPDLAGYWPMDEGIGNVAHDKSGNDNHATLHGARWRRVPFPKAEEPIAWPTSVQRASGLTDEDRDVIDKAESALEDGLELFHWWQKTQRAGSYAERFAISDPYARSQARFGFLDKATVGGKKLPVMGTVQELLYARPQTPPEAAEEEKARLAENMRNQIREFMLRYFMRVANHHAPQFNPPKSVKVPPKWLRPFSWAVGGPADRRDWGYQQLYYKRVDGETGKFDESERRTIVDVRELVESYEWIVLEVKVFDFALTFPPFTDRLPTMSVPARSTVHVVMSRDFLMDFTTPGESVTGRYGWGYALIRPELGGRALGYGPDALGPAFVASHFDVHDDGQARLFHAFVSNQPSQLVDFSLNPMDWGVAAADFASLGFLKPVLEPLQKASHNLPFGRARLRPVFNFIAMSNLLTGGLASRELSISKEQLLKEVMAVHSLDTYHFALGTLETWNQVPDWTAEGQLPSWVVAGRSS